MQRYRKFGFKKRNAERKNIFLYFLLEWGLFLCFECCVVAIRQQHYWQAVSSCRGRFIVPVYLYSICICNPFETHLCNVRNVFAICVLHIRRVKVWFLRCKSIVFGVQKGGFYIAKVWFLHCKKGGGYFLASALLQCCDVLAAFYSVYFSVAITILVFPRCVRFVCLCCQKPVAFVPFVPFQFCLLFVSHGQ